MKKVDSKELKSPDKLQQELQKGFQWSAQHSKLVGVLLLGFVVVGAGISAKSYLDEKKESELQSKYYVIEKKLFDKKSAFQVAEAAAARKDNKTPPPPNAEKSSGDFEKDYGPIATEFSTLIQEAPQSKAAKMAALNLSDIQLEYSKNQEALELLKKVETGKKDLLSGMVQTQLGTVQADLNDCGSALSTWSQVLNNASAKPLHAAVKLKQGLCYESMKDFAKAEQMYTEAKTGEGEGETATARTADKYLRLLQTAKK
ncbi:MAG: tetratricopeptide repeat protein [Pseudobdellovibrionaceae bacterium]